MSLVIACTARRPRGVPFINHGPLDRDISELTAEFSLTRTAFLEAHLANGTVIAHPVAELKALLMEAALHEVDGRLIGITASNQRICALRTPRNVYPFLRADETGARTVENYQERFPPPPRLKQVLQGGLAFTLDPADYSHRQSEIHAVLDTLAPGPAATVLERFQALAEAYGADDLRAGDLVQTQIYTTNPQAEAFGDERTEIIRVHCPTAHLTSDIRASAAPSSATDQLAFSFF